MTSRVQTGITLIELVVSAALLGVLAAVGFGAMVQAISAQEHAASSLDELRTIQRVVARLDRELEASAVRQIRTQGVFLAEALVGTETTLEFSTASIHPFGGEQPRSHLTRVRYVAEAGGLTREQWSVLDRSGDSEPATRGEVLDGVTRLAFEFLNKDGQWSAQWPGGNSTSLPLAVQMTAQLTGIGELRRVWPLAAPQ